MLIGDLDEVDVPEQTATVLEATDRDVETIRDLLHASRRRRLRRRRAIRVERVTDDELLNQVTDERKSA